MTHKKGQFGCCDTDNHLVLRCKDCWYALSTCGDCYKSVNDIDQGFMDFHFANKRHKRTPYIKAGECYNCHLMADKKRNLGGMIKSPDSKEKFNKMLKTPDGKTPRDWKIPSSVVGRMKLKKSAVGKKIKDIKKSDRINA